MMLTRALYGALSLLLFCAPLAATLGANCAPDFCPLMAKMAEAARAAETEAKASDHCQNMGARETVEKSETERRTATPDRSITSAQEGMDCCWTAPSPTPVVRANVLLLPASPDSMMPTLELVAVAQRANYQRSSQPHRSPPGTPTPALYSLFRSLLI